jgi:hypothetical protein
MPSSFTWLDYSERERRQAQHVISLFREQDTRDELGLATIRDTFADLFFPGTSTIQTRARYFLFVPWLYRWLEGKRVSSAQIGARVRWEELAMVETLIKQGEYAGVIGAVARKSLQRTPSSIYWFGLGAWGMRLFGGSQEQYHASLDAFYHRSRAVQRADDGEPIDGVGGGNWHTGLPPAPASFPSELTLPLHRVEAEYLRERIMMTNRDSLLGFLVDRGKPVDKVPFVWEHPQYHEFPEQVRSDLEHARCLSETMHGAALLYNHMLGKIAPGKLAENAEKYREALASWAADMKQRRSAHERWSIDSLWDLLASRHAHIPFNTRAFVSSWVMLVLGSDLEHIADNERAQRLVREREISLKRGRARLVNPRSLELWSGASGSAQLNYRWPGTEIIVNDILTGLTREDDDA